MILSIDDGPIDPQDPPPPPRCPTCGKLNCKDHMLTEEPGIRRGSL